MNKKEFEKIKLENPNSRIWQRDWGYQKARDELASALNAERSKLGKTNSRIWQRDWEYQKDPKARSVLNAEKNENNVSWRNKLLKSLNLKKDISLEEAKKNYFIQKAFSKECRVKDGNDFKLVLDKDFKEYIWSLSTEDLQSFADSITDGLDIISKPILFASEVMEDIPTDDEIAPFIVWNKLLDYIAKNRSDVKVNKVEINASHTHVKV